FATTGDGADCRADRGATDHLLGPRPLVTSRAHVLCLDRQNPVADLHVGERHADGRLALHLAGAIHRAHDAVDFRAAWCDQAPGSREILIEVSAAYEFRGARFTIGLIAQNVTNRPY